MLVMTCLWAWADNSVTVSYNGSTATVTVDDNVAQYLTVTQSGAHVSIAQSSAVAEEITYTLTGTSTDGEFYMSGSYKATIELNGLTLTNMTPVYSGAAVHIQNGKRINVKVITGTTNTLIDAASGSQKGCLYVKGHAEFKQYGTLNIVGKVSHGIKAGEYISIKNATINVTSAVGDGISCNQYFLMESGSVDISGTGDDGIQCDLDGDTSTGMTPNHEDEDSGNLYLSGGTITINCPAVAAKGIKSVGDVYISDNVVINVTTTGHGMWDTTDQETKAACGLDADGNITISGGTITLTATGSGGKGMKCDNVLTISGGNTTVSTTGGLYYNNGSTQNLNYMGNVDNINDNYLCAPKGVKAGTKTTSGNNTTYAGGIDVSGGKISVTTTGNNAEGIESKNYLNITGGEITVDAHDDGINAAQDLTITDGYVYSRGSNNDGIDANGNVLIYGGLVYAVGANSPEVAIDANSEGGKKFYFYGGTIIAIGGLERGSELNQTCYQASSWSSNTWYSMTYGSTVIAFRTPTSGGSPLVVSAPSTPTLKSGITVNGGTSIFEGRCYLNPTTTGGSNVSLSQYTSGGGGGNPPGPGQNYTISATANPTAGGSVSGAGTYPRNATCTLTATANSGYTFANWTRNGNVVSTNATYSFQVTGNASFVANFTQISYTVAAVPNPTEGGTVSGTGTFNQGQQCTVTATANEGYTFSNWTENNIQVSTEASYTFVVTANRSLVANFEEYHPEGAYLIVVGHTPDVAPVNEETNMSLSLKNVGTESTNGITTVSLSCDDERMTIVDGVVELGVLAANETINLQDAFSFIIAEEVAHGTQFQIEITMTCGTETWTGIVSVTAIGDVCMLYFNLADSFGDGWNNASLTVSFSDGTASQVLTVSSGYSDSYALEVGNGVHVTLTWTKGRYDNECSFTVSYEGDLIIYEMATYANPSAGVLYEFDCNCAAASQTFIVTATSSNVSHGTVSGGGEYSYGESCTVTASAVDGYLFAGWTENGEVVSGANPYTFTVTSDHDFVATFLQAIEIGTSETTSTYLPSYSWYKQALSQQIYTVDEIGTAGSINFIAFYNEGAERTRTYDFYLKTTEKMSFSGNTDWITVAESDKVFSGSVTMAANAWTFIVFSTPFEYDGTSNVVLVADDNSGRYDSSPHMACSVFSTESPQAIYVYSDDTNYNPMSPPTSYGYYDNYAILTKKNHILLGVETSVSQVQQTIELNVGWNWISTYIDLNEVDGLAMLEASLGDYGVTIATSDDIAEYLGDGFWLGLEGYQWTNSEMIMVEVNEDCTVSLEGSVVNPSMVSITINPGWNWIGFPVGSEMSLEDALAGFEPELGDGIASYEGITEYIGTWTGDFMTFVPGHGYLYYSASATPKTLVFSTGTK